MQKKRSKKRPKGLINIVRLFDYYQVFRYLCSC